MPEFNLALQVQLYAAASNIVLRMKLQMQLHLLIGSLAAKAIAASAFRALSQVPGSVIDLYGALENEMETLCQAEIRDR